MENSFSTLLSNNTSNVNNTMINFILHEKFINDNRDFANEKHVYFALI